MLIGDTVAQTSVSMTKGKLSSGVKGVERNEVMILVYCCLAW